MHVLNREELVSRLQRRLPRNPRIVASGNAAYPFEAMKIVDETFDEYIIHALNAPAGIPTRDGVTAETAFVGAGMRRHPHLRYVPSHLSRVPLLFGSALQPDAVVLNCAPARNGKFSLGIEVNVLPGAIDACRARGGVVIAAVNEHMPYTLGDAEIEEDLIDYAIDLPTPLPVGSPPRLDDAALTIGRRVASAVPDGATLQLGIGAVPDATLQSIAQKRGLRIWSEMFSDGVVALDRVGAMDPDHPIIASFIFGTQQLYEWVDSNPRVRLLRTEKVNDPSRIALQPLMTSVNTALEVDLFAQANASRINARIHSGFGGQLDFIIGALHSPGGQAFIALRSWHPKADVSTIVPLLDEPVTSMQMNAVVTENGLARIWGNDERTQARNLINNAAHPDVREELWDEAANMGLAQRL